MSEGANAAGSTAPRSAYDEAGVMTVTGAGTTVLSVRGDARSEVAPDQVTLTCAVRADEREKAAALRTVAGRLDAVLAELRTLGGQPRVAAAKRRALTWLAHSATSHVETEWVNKSERPMPTGRIIAQVSLRIEVRDFAILDRLGAVLAAHGSIHVENVEWSVDDDNPAWPGVRAAAIQAAIVKARDYASALGGSLQHIDHLADVGLLDGASAPGRHELAFSAGLPAGFDVNEGDVPGLDPIPQQLEAVVEARFTASVSSLG